MHEPAWPSTNRNTRRVAFGRGRERNRRRAPRTRVRAHAIVVSAACRTVGDDRTFGENFMKVACGASDIVVRRTNFRSPITQQAFLRTP